MDVWLSRFGVPLYVVTDRGSQFESELFSHLSAMIGFHRLRTTAYTPHSNGLVERSHRTLKAAIMARKQEWLQALPVVMLGIRAMPNESGFSPFTAVTGSQLLFPRISVDVESSTSRHDFIRELSQIMNEVDFHSMSEGRSHSSMSESKAYIPKDLGSCSHVWVRVDRVRRPLESPYIGPLRVVNRSPKFFIVEFPSGETDTVSINRLKPAYLPPAAESLHSVDRNPARRGKEASTSRLDQPAQPDGRTATSRKKRVRFEIPPSPVGPYQLRSGSDPLRGPSTRAAGYGSRNRR